MHLSKNLISTVATDGHRLSKSSLTKDYSGDFDGIIIPKKTVIEISKILEEFEGKISLHFSKNKTKNSFFGNVKIITKLINSSFPDCKVSFQLQTIKLWRLIVKVLVNV